MTHRLARFLGAFGFLWALASSVAADPTYPAFTAPVVDAAGVLSADEQTAITRKLLVLQTKSHIQFVVATVPSLGGDEIEPYANALFRQWKLGEKGVNNGLLLVVAPKEHKLRFEVGYGLEGVMTDLQSKLIIANTMVPKLKAGDIAGAVDAGVDNAITVLTTDKASWPQSLKPASDDGTSDMIVGFVVIGFILLFVIIGIVRSRRGGGWRWGTGWTTSSGFTAGNPFNSSSSSNDSFSGGGGGDSGGGGASGSW